MRKELQKLAEDYIRGGSKRKRLRVFVSVLSLIVTLSTLYILSTPAITLEKASLLEVGEQIDTGKSSGDEGNPISQEENANIGDSTSEGDNTEEDKDTSPESGGDTGQTVGDEPQQPGDEKDDTQSGETSDDAEKPADEGNSGEVENPDESTPPDNDPADDSGSQEDTDSGKEEDSPEGEETEEDADSKDEEKESENEDADSEKPEEKFERTVYEYLEDGLAVTAVLSDPAAVSDEAELSVTRITEESDPERYTQFAELLQAGSGTENSTFLAYDISFVLDGAEIEPTGGTVSVTIQDTAELAVTAEAAMTANAAENIQVFHVLNEDGDAPELQEVADPVAAEGGSVSFTAESFSAYVVTLSSGTTYVLPDGTELVIPNGSSLTYKPITDKNDFLNYSSTYYNPNSPLGIAGSFHVVAFDTATLTAHTNGNVLAKKLNSGASFGTNNLVSELSYVQNYAQVSSNSASNNSHVLTIGSSNTLTLQDNGNAFGLNGTKLDKPKNIWQDADTATSPFIDLDFVKNEVAAVSASMNALSSSNIDSTHLSASAGSCAESYLLLTDPDSVGVYNITAAQLNNYKDKYFGVKGFLSSHDGTVIINVDCTGVSQIDLPNCEMFVDNNNLGFPEASVFLNGRVIWNFVNCTGTINTERMYASIIAPDATINVEQNLNGTVIGKCVNIKAESHRDDFVGKLPACVTVSKVWRDSDGIQISGAALDGMSVTVQLYRSNGGAKTVVGVVTLNGDNNWSYAWAGLAKGYTYSVEEIAITKNGSDISQYYSVTYSSDGLCSGTIYVYNQFQYSLPSTGGKGTQPFTIAGLFLIGAALYINTKLKRPGKRGGAPNSA